MDLRGYKPRKFPPAAGCLCTTVLSVAYTNVRHHDSIRETYTYTLDVSTIKQSHSSVISERVLNLVT